MPRWLMLAPLVLVLAACGGGKSTSSSDNPLVDAANATAEAGSEQDATSGKVTYDTPDGRTTLVLRGDGGYNHTTDEGWQHLVVSVPNSASPCSTRSS